MRPRCLFSRRFRADARPGPVAALLGLLCMGGFAGYAGTTADPIDEILSTRPTGDTSTVEHVRKLIIANPNHPRILELRLFHTGQLMGTSQDPKHFRWLIEELKKLAEDAKRAPILAFRAQVRIGDIYHDCLRGKEAAYRQFASLENHPSLAGRDLETDLRRVTLYVRIAGSALAVGERNEVERCTRLAMDYPHLGMEDRVMYRRFYELYEEAGRLYLTQFDRDLVKLLSVEFYPSHPRLVEWRNEAITALLREPAQ